MYTLKSLLQARQAQLQGQHRGQTSAHGNGAGGAGSASGADGPGEGQKSKGKTKIHVTFTPDSQANDLLRPGETMAHIGVTTEKVPDDPKPQGKPPGKPAGAAVASAAGTGTSAAGSGGGAATAVSSGGGGGSAAAPSSGSGSTVASSGGAASNSSRGPNANQNSATANGQPKAQLDQSSKEALQAINKSSSLHQAGSNGSLRGDDGQDLPIPADGGELKTDKTVRMAYLAPEHELQGDGSVLLAYQNMDKQGGLAHLYFNSKLNATDGIAQLRQDIKANPNSSLNYERLQTIKRLQEDPQGGDEAG